MSSSTESSGHEKEKVEQNETQSIEGGQPQGNPFECPSEYLKKHAKGFFCPKKPLLQFATHLDKRQKEKHKGY